MGKLDEKEGLTLAFNALWELATEEQRQHFKKDDRALLISILHKVRLCLIGKYEGNPIENALAEIDDNLKESPNND